MEQSHITTAGRVWKAGRVVTPENGTKPFVSCIIELQRRHYQDKSYAQRVEIRVYCKELDDMAARLTEGTLVLASGNGDAYLMESSGKHYANLRVTTNTVSFLDCANPSH